MTTVGKGVGQLLFDMGQLLVVQAAGNIKSNHENTIDPIWMAKETQQQQKVHVVTLGDPLGDVDTTVVDTVHVVLGDCLGHG